LTPADYETWRRSAMGCGATWRSPKPTPLRGAHLPTAQALLAIKVRTATKAMSIGDLAAELLIKHHSTVELVGRLENGGFTSARSTPMTRAKSWSP
jgi:hypothetical protein